MAIQDPNKNNTDNDLSENDNYNQKAQTICSTALKNASTELHKTNNNPNSSSSTQKIVATNQNSSRVTINLDDPSERPSLYNIAKHSVTTMDIHTSYTGLQEHHPRTYTAGVLTWLAVIIVNAMLLITVFWKDEVYSRINTVNLENQDHNYPQNGNITRQPDRE